MLCALDVPSKMCYRQSAFAKMVCFYMTGCCHLFAEHVCHCMCFHLLQLFHQHVYDCCSCPISVFATFALQVAGWCRKTGLTLELHVYDFCTNCAQCLMVQENWFNYGAASEKWIPPERRVHPISEYREMEGKRDVPFHWNPAQNPVRVC